AVTLGKDGARNVDEMLLVVRPAQTARELQIVEDVVIYLAEARIGIEQIGILAEEIVMPRIIEAIDRIGIHPATSISGKAGILWIDRFLDRAQIVDIGRTLRGGGVVGIPIGACEFGVVECDGVEEDQIVL